MAAVTLSVEQKAISTMQTDAWKQETVGAFFARCNWENLTLPVQDVSGPGAVLALDYSLSVGQFFGAIPWAGGDMMTAQQAVEGIPVLTASGSELGEQSVESGSSLDELPDLSDIADESHLDGGDVTLDDFLGAFSNSL